MGLLFDERVNNAIDFVIFRAVDRTKHFGGGIEWQLSQSIGISTEGSVYLVPDMGFLSLSVNGSYRFRSAPPGRRSLVPFLTDGLSLPGPSSPGINIGMGADYSSGDVTVFGSRFAQLAGATHATLDSTTVAKSTSWTIRGLSTFALVSISAALLAQPASGSCCATTVHSGAGSGTGPQPVLFPLFPASTEVSVPLAGISVAPRTATKACDFS